VQMLRRIGLNILALEALRSATTEDLMDRRELKRRSAAV